MSAHTHGPWFYDKTDGVVFCTFDGDERDCDICTMPILEAESSEELAIHANARLIAAAPDLLEALEKWLNIVSDASVREPMRATLREHEKQSFQDVCTKTFAAIAKARGGK